MRQLIKAWLRLWLSAIDVAWAWLVFQFFVVVSLVLKKLYGK